VAQVHSFCRTFRANFQTAGGWIAKAATIGNFVGLTWIGLSVVVCTLIVQGLMRDVVTIAPIEVPKALSDNGYTPEVAGRRLRDATNAYADQATSLGEDGARLSWKLGFIDADNANLNFNLNLNISARDELPDVVVPQIGLSPTTIVSSIRSVLHRTGHAISGELTPRRHPPRKGWQE
jgi:hypothetical protein